MAMLANRSPAGLCLCKRCVKPDERREIRRRNRLREERQWRKDADEMSWAQEQYELDAWYERIEYETDPCYELPPGFDGAWSTESGNVPHGQGQS